MMLASINLSGRVKISGQVLCYQEETPNTKLRHIKFIPLTGNGCVKRSADIIKEHTDT